MTFPFDIPDDQKDNLVRKLLEYTTNLDKKITLLLEDKTRLLEEEYLPEWVSYTSPSF